VKNADALVSALEKVTLRIPEDPDGFTSHMDAATHQLIQAHANGVTEPNRDYSPATRMLGKFVAYDAATLVPTAQEVARRRSLAR
jgi:branched-chain amino acid transport system substrate-binding protein